MTTISGTSSASSAQYASSIQSSHGAGQAGGMNAMKLQQWLEGQVGEMWSKVSDATSGVDQRNNAQRELAELQRRATNNEPISADEVRAVAAKMPDGPEKDNVLGLVGNAPTPEALEKLDAEYKDATAASDAATKKYSDWKASHPTMMDAMNPHYGVKLVEFEKAQVAKINLDKANAATSVSGTNVAKGFENAADALDKKNTLVMNELQYMASAAQQAMSLVSNILKIQSDSAKEVIGKIA